MADDELQWVESLHLAVPSAGHDADDGACMRQAEEGKKVEALITLQSAIKFNGGGASAAAITVLAM